MTIQDLITQTAQSLGVNPALALQVALAESSLDQSAISPKGAIGIFQLMPGTAAQLGVNPYDLQDNIRGGITYLRQMLAQFGDLAAALAAYNWGPDRVASAIAQHGAGWIAFAPAETRAYVLKILQGLQGSPASAPSPDLSPALDSQPPAPYSLTASFTDWVSSLTSDDWLRVGVVAAVGIGFLALVNSD